MANTTAATSVVNGNSSNNNKTVLVIGGGCGGVSFITALRKLDPNVNIVLVEPKDFCELVWASYRSPFDPKVAERSTCLLADFCEEKTVQHLRTKVVSLTMTKTVDGDSQAMTTLADGTTIHCHAAVISVGATIPAWSGSGNGLPVGYDGSRVERLANMKDHGERLLRAEQVVIVGGGLIGVELAGDVAGYSKQESNDKDKHVHKKVTLVHSGDRLMPEFSEGASAMAKQKLEKLGVKVILNERGVQETLQDGKSVVVLQGSQEVLEADEVAMVVGLRANNTFVNIDGACDDKGFLETDDYFRVTGSDGKVFGFGDCCTTLRNAAYLIMQNGGVVAHNVKAVLDNNVDDEEKTLKKMDEGMVGGMVTIGPNDGVAQLPWFSTQYLLPRFKNYTMMIPSSKPLMGIN